MTESAEPEGQKLWVPTGAIVVYPMPILLGMFGHHHPGSVRNAMSRHGHRMAKGYLVEDVDSVLSTLGPEAGWPRTRGARTRT